MISEENPNKVKLTYVNACSRAVSLNKKEFGFLGHGSIKKLNQSDIENKRIEISRDITCRVPKTRALVENKASGGRVSMPRFCIPSRREKSTSSRLPKGHFDNKASASLHAVHSNCLPVEKDEDQEELLEAANSIHYSSYLACCSSFWKNLEPIFAAIDLEDISYLKQQMTFSEVVLSHTFSSKSDTQDPVILTEALDPHMQSEDLVNGQPKEIMGISSSCTESLDVDIFNKNEVKSRKWLESVIPLSQRLLAALIVEDSPFAFDCNSYWKDDFLSRFHMENYMEVETEDSSKTESGVTSHYSSDEQMVETDFLISEDSIAYSPVESSHMENTQPEYFDHSSLDCEYQQMSLDERILLELRSVGLYPDVMPDFSDNRSMEIDEALSLLKEELKQQMMEIRRHLSKIDKAIEIGKDEEERKLEQCAMNHLVEIAYKKYKSFIGNKNKKRGVPSKEASWAFTSRTLARCQTLIDTGRSCFRDSFLWDVILSPSLYKTYLRLCDDNGANQSPKSQSHVSGASALEMVVPQKSDPSSHQICPSYNQTKRRREKRRPYNSVQLLPFKSMPMLQIQMQDRRNHKSNGQHASKIRLEEKASSKKSSSSQTNKRRKGNKEDGLKKDKLQEHGESVELSNIKLDRIGIIENFVVTEGEVQDFSSFLNFDVDGLQLHDGVSMGLDIPMDDLFDVL